MPLLPRYFVIRHQVSVRPFCDLTPTRQTLSVYTVINHRSMVTMLPRTPQTAPLDQAFHVAGAGHHAPAPVGLRADPTSDPHPGLVSPTRLRWVRRHISDDVALTPSLAPQLFRWHRAFQYVCVAGVCEVEKVVGDVLAQVCLRWKLNEL